MIAVVRSPMVHGKGGTLISLGQPLGVAASAIEQSK